MAPARGVVPIAIAEVQIKLIFRFKRRQAPRFAALWLLPIEVLALPPSILRRSIGTAHGLITVRLALPLVLTEASPSWLLRLSINRACGFVTVALVPEGRSLPILRLSLARGRRDAGFRLALPLVPTEASPSWLLRLSMSRARGFVTVALVPEGRSLPILRFSLARARRGGSVPLGLTEPLRPLILRLSMRTGLGCVTFPVPLVVIRALPPLFLRLSMNKALGLVMVPLVLGDWSLPILRFSLAMARLGAGVPLALLIVGTEALRPLILRLAMSTGLRRGTVRFVVTDALPLLSLRLAIAAA
jgi:hypothetical protein